METVAKTDLPPNSLPTEQKIIAFFDNKFKQRLEFASNDFDAVIGFFEKRGFDKSSATAIGQVLLAQAKMENVKIFKLLDSLKGYTKIELNNIVLKILNSNRDKVSQLGFRQQPKTMKNEERNIGDTITNPEKLSALNFNTEFNNANQKMGVVQGQKVLLIRNDGEIS